MSNSYFPEGEYRPQAQGGNYAPIDIAKLSSSMDARNAQIMRDMGNKYEQQVKIDNQASEDQLKKTQAALESLSKFSETLTSTMTEQYSSFKEAMGQRATNDALMEGITPEQEQETEAVEAQIDSDGQAIRQAADNYEMETGDTETARKWYQGTAAYQVGYEKAKLGIAAAEFPAYYASQVPTYTINVDGRPVTMATADAAGREAIRTSIAADYLKPYSGYNVGFVNKQLLAPMREHMMKQSASETAAYNKSLQNQRIDDASVALHAAPSADKFQELYQAYLVSGKSPGEARVKALGELARSDDLTGINAVLDSPFGPNGKPLREQYKADVQDMLTTRNQEREQAYQLGEFERKAQEREEIDAFDEALIKDANDGKIDVSPEYLQQEAIKARMNGQEALAKHIESKIPLTSASQYRASITAQVENQLSMGIIPNAAEIRNDPMLDLATKTKLLKQIEGKAASTVPSNSSKNAEKLIKTALSRRVGYDMVAGGKKHESLDWAIDTATNRWNSVYAQELARTNGDHEAARKAADDDFKAAYEDEEGIYGLADAVESGEFGVFKGYDSSGKAYTYDNTVKQVRMKMQSGADILYSENQLYPGERAGLEQMDLSMRNTGKLIVPPIYYDISQGSGGKVSVVDILNARSKALGTEPLPTEVTSIIKDTESVFDTSGFNWRFRPNTIKTDIASIGATGEAVYAQSTPLGDEVKAIFGKRESPQAAYDAINAGQGGDRPGGATRHLGKPLTQMTLGEVKAYQNLPIGDPKGIFAVGKYQFIPDTLAAAAQDAGITDDMLFNEAVQDRIFFVHLDNNGYYQPWEQWWIKQGGSHLALTAEEKAKIERFRSQYDPAKPWRSERNMRQYP